MSDLDAVGHEQQIQDDGDLKNYRTEIPNMADDDLDPYEYRLYGHYKRRGNCYEAVRTTAKVTQMSVGMVVQTRDKLALNGWITVETQANHKTLLIRVKDRWLENFERYSERSPHEHKRSLGEPKKDNNHADGQRPTIARIWTDNIHPNLSPFDEEYLHDLEEVYGYDTVVAKIKDASNTKGADKKLLGVKYLGKMCANNGSAKPGAVPANYREGWKE